MNQRNIKKLIESMQGKKKKKKTSKKMSAVKEALIGRKYFSTLPSWFTNLWILVVASIYGIKGTQIFRNGGKK